MRVTVGIVAGGLILFVIGFLAFPALVFSKDRPMGTSIRATESHARVLAERLSFSMTDQEIADEVAQMGWATIGELHREPDETAVLVLISASVAGPTEHACYRFTMREGHVAHEEATGCPALPLTFDR